MECVRASGVADGSRRRPETTHEVLCYLEVARRQYENMNAIIPTCNVSFARGSLARWLHHSSNNGLDSIIVFLHTDVMLYVSWFYTYPKLLPNGAK